MLCTTCRYIPRTAILEFWMEELLENIELDPENEFHFIFGSQEEFNKLYLLYADKPNAFNNYLVRIRCYELDPKSIPYDVDFIFSTTDYFADFYAEVVDYIISRFKPFNVLYRKIQKLKLEIVYEDDDDDQ